MTGGDPALGARAETVVAGIGSEYRRDDGVGIAVARLVAGDSPGVVDVGPLGEPLDLLGRWDGVELAVVVDALRSEEPPGTVRVLELDAPGLAGPGARTRGADARASTHGLGVADVLRLSHAVGCAPRRVVVVGVVGERFDEGIGLSRAVGAALDGAVAAVRELLAAPR